jgi:hypothetical protein
MAKAAVLAHRVPAHSRRNIKQHANLVTANARWIARATLIASDQLGQPARDTEASRARAAKAAAEKRKLKVTTNHNCSLKRGEIVARPSHQGGHILERHGAGWWCTCCRARSIKWEKLAMQMCGGPAEAKWASRASKSSSCRGARRTHKTQKDGDVIWCTRCGAYGTEAPRLLTTACRGNPKGDDRRKGMEWRLRRLEQGLHPKTGAPLVLEKPRAKKQQQQQGVAPSAEAVQTAEPPPPKLVDDGTEFTRAFIRRGKRELQVQAETNPLARFRARSAVAELERYSNKRKIQDILNSDELLDPDLVAFWGLIEGDADDTPPPSSRSRRAVAKTMLANDPGSTATAAQRRTQGVESGSFSFPMSGRPRCLEVHRSATGWRSKS